MKLKVIIHRQRRNEPGEGTLRAWVQQGKTKGDNLLQGKQFTNVDNAICECDARLLKMFKLIELGSIEYEVDEDPERNKDSGILKPEGGPERKPAPKS